MDMAVFLRRVTVVGLLSVVALVPLYVADGLFFPFITGKGFFFRIAVEILFGAWVLLAYRDPAYRPRASYILYSVAALVCVMTIADIFSPNPGKSIWSNYERMEGLVTLVHLLAYFVVAVSVLTTAKLWERVFQASLCVSVYVGGYGVLQYVGLIESYQSATRIESTFGNSAYLAVYALIHAFLAAFLALRARGPWVKYVQVGYALVAALNLFVLYYTGTRGTMLGLVVGVLVTLGLLAAERERRARFLPWAVGAMLFVVIAAGALVTFKDSSFIKESPVLSRFAPAAVISSFVDARFPVWEAGIKGFLERPIFGWGQESFNYVFNEHYDPKMYAQEAWFDRAHNVFLDWLVAGGILGLLAYLALFTSALYVMWFRPIALSHAEKSVITGLLAAYFVHNIFVFDNLMSYVLFFVILGFVHVLSAGATEANGHAQMRSGSRDARPADPASALVVGIMTLVLVWMVNHDAIAQNKTLIDALKPAAPSVETLQYMQNVFASGQVRDRESLADFLSKMLTEERLANTIEVLASGTITTVDQAAIVTLNALQEESLAQFKKAIAYGSLGTSEVREHLIMRAANVLGSPYANDELKRAFVIFATQEIASQAEALPDDARYQYMAGSFIAKTEGLVKVEGVAPGETYYLRALELSPKKQMFLIDLGYVYLAQGDAVRALEKFKEAYELEPKYEGARIAYAAGAIYAGDTALADELIAPLGVQGKTDSGLIRAYVLTNNYARATELILERAALEPENADVQKQLASVYVSAGKRAEAIKALTRAIELDPSYKEQGEYYIGELEAGRNP